MSPNSEERPTRSQYEQQQPADSLRYDSVAADDREHFGVPYLGEHGTHFSQARSAGSWTLPATASMFTGLLPHEHGATSQTRMIGESLPTLAERMKSLGYKTVQITANPVTTHIFGLDRGFDEVERVWKRTDQRHTATDTVLAILAKSRMRRKLFTDTEDFVMGRMSDDIEAASAWMQSNAEYQFNRTHEVIEQANRDGQPVFVFVNVMETHFPYHIDDTFRTSREEMIDKIRELWSLFHYVNQTRLTSDKEYVAPDMLDVLRRRQQTAWSRLAPKLDSFVREIHEDTDNMVIALSDHGDNFGEQGWQYHFSNVTDAGNRVPIWVLEPGQNEGTRVDERVSLRDLYGTILRNSGFQGDDLVDLLDAPERSESVLESYWYNRDGKTLDKYRFNQFAFVDDDDKYVRRNDEWLSSRIANGEPESNFKPLPPNTNPIEEIDLPEERRSYLRDRFHEYDAFSRNVLEFSGL
ncbi:MAG: sulfatase-like hydrolase/transferase [Bradymonadaceae bacterium]